MGQSLESILNSIVGILWGPPLLIALLGTGLFFSVKTNFWQLRYLPLAFKHCFFPAKYGAVMDQQGGILTPYQAASIAIAGAIGTGNIGGVASAIALGGPGAVFWMWVTAILGMMTKMVEIALAVYFRDRKADGSTWGGPSFYMEKGLGRKFKHWRILAVIFGFGIFIQWVFSPETFTVAEALSEATGMDTTLLSVFYAIMIWIVVLGGLKNVAKFAAFMMPLMSISYLAGGILILILGADKLPGTFALIFEHAFKPAAAVGGFAGASFMLALRTGVSRSLFSNEAGWGLSPMASATSRTAHPIEQGLWGMIEVFVDTLLVCTTTALVIINTGEWSSGAAGATLTMRAFRAGLGSFGFYFVPILLFLFSWTTSTGWSTYFVTLIQHAFKGRPEKVAPLLKWFWYIYPIPGLLLALFVFKINLSLDFAWLFVDISTSLPTYANLFALVCLSGTFFKLLKDYEGPKKLWGKENFLEVDLTEEDSK